ncbi:MAG: hypothetical protein ACPL1Y_01900, partial [Thermoplasmata archaeon]
MKCEKCKTEMMEVNRQYVLADVDFEELTEGEMADYMAAELSGDFGEWGVTEITYQCGKCGKIVTIQVDSCQLEHTRIEKHKTIFDRGAKRLRELVDKAKEYEIFEHEKEISEE